MKPLLVATFGDSFGAANDQTCEDKLSEMLSEMLSSCTVYVDQKRDEDVFQVEVEMLMVDGSTWFQRFTITNMAFARWGSTVVSK